MPPYVPIACGFHDRLEHYAVRGETVEVAWTAPDGARRQRLARITDVFAENGADWVRLSTGETVRADALAAVDGVVRPAPC